MKDSTIKTSKEAQLSKLRNIKEHLQALLSKKARLELEIRSLRQSYKKKTAEFQKAQKQFKIAVSLEGSQEFLKQNDLTPEDFKNLEELDGLIALESEAIQELFDSDALKKENINTFLAWCQDMMIPQK